MAVVSLVSLPTWWTQSTNSASSVRKGKSLVRTNRTARTAVGILFRRVAQAARNAKRRVSSMSSAPAAPFASLEKAPTQIAPSVSHAKVLISPFRASASCVTPRTLSTRTTLAATGARRASTQTKSATIVSCVHHEPSPALAWSVPIVTTTELSSQTRQHAKPVLPGRAPALISCPAKSARV